MIPVRLATRLGSALVGASGLFVLLALVSYDPTDLAVLTSAPNAPLDNINGVVGAWLAFVCREGLGWAAFLVPGLCAIVAVQLWQGRPSKARWLIRGVACVGLVVSAATLAALGQPDGTGQARVGGLVGYLLARGGRYYLGATGTGLVAGCVLVLSWILAVDRISWPGLLSRILARLKSLLAGWQAKREGEPEQASTASRMRVPREQAAAQFEASVSPTPSAATVSRPEPPPGPRIRSTVSPKPKAIPSQPLRSGFHLPPIDLLTTPPPAAERQLGEDVQMNARILEETLREFGIEASCVNIVRGPTVTRYELAPAPGVKLTKIVSLADDLALVLKAASCHVVAPIPGKGLVGVEAPNSTATVVYLKEVLASRPFQQLTSPLALAIGKDVSGHPVVADLRECPHLLVAGTTGSGKTVCLNGLLTGILCHASPDEVKFLMVDPKMVELALFNDIPHLVAPVVTDAKRAAVALNWAVAEMERRYKLLAESGVRNIDAYNEKCSRLPGPPHALAGAGKAEGSRQTSSLESRTSSLEPFPYLVIVIDELADLMMIASQEVEESITRLSQLSRAVGLHIILATQRPSVDVITGVIKANFPTRIAFQVASKVDSRTILDMNGADKLLGRGDLMFLRPGTAKPIRAQGSFVTDAEIERVANYIKAQRQPSYDEQFMSQHERPVASLITEKDELYEMAKRLVLEAGQASTSLLQRRLRLGYARAARILDLMEQEGLVGPPQGSRPREVLVSSQLSASP